MWKLAFALLLVALTWSGRAEATRRALVIGENVGLGPDAPLRFAEDDARSVAATLEEVAGVRHEEMTLLTGASLGVVRASVRKLAARSQAGDELIVFFSGHGGPDGAHVAGQVWPWTDVRADLESIQARLVAAFFDACFSGALLTPKGLVRESPLVLSVVTLSARGRYLVTSSGANELSYESGLIQGSPFAEALRSGLRGGADANADGEVTLPELYDYIYARTLSATVGAPSGPQHPLQSVRLESEGEVVLVELHRSGTAPVRGATALGRCYVLDRDSTRVVAELEKPTPPIFVSRAEYLIKCVQGDRVRVARASLGGVPVSLDDLHYATEAPTDAIVKGPGGASESRLSVSLGGVSTEMGGALLLGYQGGSDDLLGSVEAGVTWKGEAIFAAGVGMHVPWWKLGGSSLVLGLEAGGAVLERPAVLALGGGSFLTVESPPVFGSARVFARLDLLATHPLNGGDFGATFVGSAGFEVGR
jgi:hypothetical protein